MRGEHDRLPRNLRDRHEILQRVVVDLVDMRIADDRFRHDQDGVAVRRSLGGELDAEIAVGAGLVLDHDLLAEHARQMLADEPGRDVGRAARRERHDHLDRTVRPLLGLRRPSETASQARQCQRGHE